MGPFIAPHTPRAGSILVIGYHAIGGPAEFQGGPLYDKHGLNISPQTFQRQLELMWQAGWYPVNMRDAAMQTMRVPQGKIPVVLTFDDGRASQYRVLPDGTLDPNCALGILLRFHRRHGDWPLAGSFYLIAGSDANGVPFDQEGLERRKCRELIRMGFEIGNHTYSHPNMAALSGRQIQREIGLCKRYLTRLVSGVRIDTLAVPYGILPKDKSVLRFLREGRCGATSYKNVAVLLFSQDRPVPWHFSPTVDAYAVPRVAPSPGAVEGWINRLRAGGEVEPYVSDGG